MSRKQLPSSSPAHSRGSVLIFVVGVLLLLAILATAFLGTSRSDRVSTQQNSFNTQIDLLLEGVVNTGKGKILADESILSRLTFTSTAFADAYTYSSTNTTGTDDWLATRVPVTMDRNNAYFGNGATSPNPDNERITAADNPAVWPAVTAPAIGDGYFESPYRPSRTYRTSSFAAAPANSPYNGSLSYTTRPGNPTNALSNVAWPSFVKIGDQTWPAFIVDTAVGPMPKNTDPTTRYQKFLAADADGDGIADAGLFRIPIGEIAGITYYGALRIIDNNSAINLNTALSRDMDFNGAANGNGALISTLDTAGSFTSNIGLAEMLRSYNFVAGAATNYDQTSKPTNVFAYNKTTNTTTAVPTNEFWNFNRLRLITPQALTARSNTNPYVPAGVAGNTNDAAPYDDSATVPGTRTDFQYRTIGEILTAQLGNRVANPGVVTVTSNAANRKSAAAVQVDSLALAGRFTLAGPTEYSVAAPTFSEGKLGARMPLTLEYVPTLYPSAAAYPANANDLLLRNTPYTSLVSGAGIDAWFGHHFDYLIEQSTGLTTATLNPATFMNRRSIVTGYNGTSTQSPALIIPPRYVFSGLAADWAGLTPARIASSYYYPNTTIIGAPMSVPVLSQTVSTNGTNLDPKISINTGRFEDLFYGYFKTMARQGFTGLGDDKGTPFSLLFDGNQGGRVGGTMTNTENALSRRSGTIAASNNARSPGPYYYDDPYVGRRYLTGGNPSSTFNPLNEPGVTSVINGDTAAIEQNPLRMFSSPLRAAAERSTANKLGASVGYWNENTPRLPADQVLILRAAIAAANVEALRDSSHNPTLPVDDAPNAANDRVIEHRVPLTAYINNVATAVTARVFGLKRQIYISEVYANTDTTNDTRGNPPNTGGYVAIKLFNPNPVPISLQYCRLVGLKRVREAAPVGTTTSVVDTDRYPNMGVNAFAVPTAANALTTDQIDFSAAVSQSADGLPAYVIPANGVLLLENFASNGAGLPDDAQHRPESARTNGVALAGIGSLLTTASVNAAYIPGLARICWDREFVIMRPKNCTPPDPGATPANLLTYVYDNPTGTAPVRIADFVPMDSYDFTGLNLPNGSLPAQTRAQMWYYSRDTTPGLWKWVYPGRYDANQSIPVAPVTTSTNPAANQPRQQGTFQAYGRDGAIGWDPTQDKDPWAERLVDGHDAGLDANNPASPTVPNMQLTAATATTATYAAAGTFTIQLNAVDWPSDATSRLRTPTLGVNLFPYGGFRRVADVLQAPFIGPYTIQLETNVGTPATGTPERFLEVNSVTMDAAMADDTDPFDNENYAGAPDNGTQSREQLGRFVPLRSSRGSAVAPGTPTEITAELHPQVAGVPSYSIAYDPTFYFNPATLTDSEASTLDPYRYGDDSPDADNADLPAGRSAGADLKLTRTNRYQFATRLFDYFATASPNDDSLPAYPTQPRWQTGVSYSIGDTVQYGQNIYVCTLAQPAAAAYPAGTLAAANWYQLPRSAVANASVTASSLNDIVPTGAGQPFDYNAANDVTEALVPKAGLININTAPEKVLAMIPWVPRGTGGDYLTFDFNANYPGTIANPLVPLAANGDGIDDNAQIAHAIVLYRDGNPVPKSTSPNGNLGITTNTFPVVGHATQPFVTLYDLYKVPGFKAAQDKLVALNRGAEQGDYSPMTAADPVRYDFEEQTLLMNRVSNLLTTRSDVFTLYALVQGWRNVGTDKPELVVQRRAAYIIDRSGVTPTSAKLNSTKVPVN